MTHSSILREAYERHIYHDDACTDPDNPDDNSGCPESIALHAAYRAALDTELVQAVRDHAQAHYNEDGWDYVIEACEDEDILREIGDATTPQAAIDRVTLSMHALDEALAERCNF